ncbi:MAG: hypothetical protein SGJ01_10720 [Gemmatimonadota bacterium]|nr:hypothetical protein [Gemmatimonadota bacterium]
MAAIIKWAGKYDDHGALMIGVNAILDRLRFGSRAEAFEAALDELAPALGFSGERPDKEWKAGPDNLWVLKEGEYLLVECKSEVDLSRESIGKAESGQMNNACAWFTREYPGAEATRIIVIPTKKISRAAGFNEKVRILRDSGLKKLTRAVRAFFMEMKNLDLHDLDESRVGGLLGTHKLGVTDLVNYAEELKS